MDILPTGHKRSEKREQIVSNDSLTPPPHLGKPLILFRLGKKQSHEIETYTGSKCTPSLLLYGIKTSTGFVE